MPGIDRVKDPAEAALAATAAGAGKLMARTGQLTTSHARVIGAYTRKGHPVANLDDIRKLDLRTIDDVASFGLAHHTYSLSAAAEGAAAGLAVSGGEAAVTAGTAATAGAAAGPGLGAVVTAMGVDTAALLTACSGVVAQDALFYGYDPRDPAEEIFMMQVIGLGLAETVSAKAIAYQQLTLLTESLTRNAAWHQLDQEAFADVAQKFAVKFSRKLTRKKVLQLVPVVGVGLGAALNWKMVTEIADAGYWAYRERFLYEKAVTADNASGDALRLMDVIDLLSTDEDE